MGRSSVETFLFGTNATFIAELYQRYLLDRAAIDQSWAQFFDELKERNPSVLADLQGVSWSPAGAEVIGTNVNQNARGEKSNASRGIVTADVRRHTLDSIRALMMIRVYRVRGHLIARLDPLGLHGEHYHPELDYHEYGFTEADLDREIFIDNVLGMETATLRQILGAVQVTYCSHIGVEFMHIQDPEQKAWIQRIIENGRNQTAFSSTDQRAILEQLTESEEFERFLHTKYVGTKRFGLEGGESLIPLLEQILKRGSQLGLNNIVLGMAHRGRLNVLAHVLKKPYRAIFSEFQGNPAHPEDVQGSGDVKYHLGTSTDRVFDNRTIHISLIANPSHLEAADPVVLGKVRANQTLRGGMIARDEVMGVILHGDAAFAGQGMVAECFGLSQLKGYCSGGTIHVIINNQIGFTTSPQHSRSSHYPSDVAKGVQAPIFHVNGDDPEAVVHVARIATEFRQQFMADVVVDMLCYRRHGHNETDEPGFTQPTMYGRIATHPTTRRIYARKLMQDNLVRDNEVDCIAARCWNRLEAEYAASTNYRPNKADWLEGIWSGLIPATGEEELHQESTDVSVDILKVVGYALFTPPSGLVLHAKILRQLGNKRRMIETGQGIDWATAETLAFGTLLVEGAPVRLSGQDSGRGTFSQRHAVLVDQGNESVYIPLNHIRDGQALFEVVDSPLSEESVLGFEYGHSLAMPTALVIWEAQFGDFANGAQVIFDQFITSGEAKWLRLSGLTIFLPHGFEGQGPEHSSGRPERYLQLTADDNIQICLPTTPANFFHLLRRQIRRNFRKPLIVFTPKTLLRHKACVSPLAAFGPASRFHRVLQDSIALVPHDQVRRVILCSGKVYYDLVQRHLELGLKDVAIVRVEQLYPWPKVSIKAQLTKYPCAELVWCQEEPANQGAFFHVDRRLQYMLEELGRPQRWPIYVGRKASASPATGLLRRHLEEQALLVEQALRWDAEAIVQPFRRPAEPGAMQIPT
ncbi:2-oxoglutarate dehydrogenase E1 component [invertebrate metagenome]|uniref:oxoglutarate dehydrogenase (succinyl-transferring) n=1 Tax=invertebrate metagenome TaxID=1711999 RepID=A0A484H633_9ZZZZ